MKLTFLAALFTLLVACTFHPVIKPPAIDIKPHVAPTESLLPTITPTPAKERN